MAIKNKKAVDNINTPLIVCQADGTVLYKNKAAIRNIKSPRCSHNINKYINEKAPAVSSNTPKARIETIVNPDSIFRRALVFTFENSDAAYEIWFFYSCLQLAEPEDINRAAMIGLARCADKAAAFLRDITNEDARPSDTRYQRMSDYMLNAMKFIDQEVCGEKFSVIRIIESIKNTTVALLPKFNHRVSFDIMAIDPSEHYLIQFRPFATVYTQLLIILLKISCGSMISVCAGQTASTLTIDFKTTVRQATSSPISGTSFEALANIIPQEYLNFIFLEQHIEIMKYKVEYSLTEKPKDNLELRLMIPLEAPKISRVRQTPAFISDMEFKRAEELVRRYMESMLPFVRD